MDHREENKCGPKKRGAFIAFEGLDKSGKTTQSKLLVDTLNNKSIPAVWINFPTRKGPIGQLIDRYLRGDADLSDQTIHLLFSADRWETSKTILDLLSRGVAVVVDRYAYSGIVFSAAKGLDLNWCVSADAGLPAPDKVIFLQVSPDAASNREGFGDERYEKAEFQKKVGAQYRALASNEEKGGNAWAVVDANKPREEVQEEITRMVLSVLQTSVDKDIRKISH